VKNDKKYQGIVDAAGPQMPADHNAGAGMIFLDNDLNAICQGEMLERMGSDSCCRVY